MDCQQSIGILKGRGKVSSIGLAGWVANRGPAAAATLLNELRARMGEQALVKSGV